MKPFADGVVVQVFYGPRSSEIYSHEVEYWSFTAATKAIKEAQAEADRKGKIVAFRIRAL